MFCRICLEDTGPFITPCRCNGTCKYVHQHCMDTWFSKTRANKCEICKYTFRFQPLSCIQTLLHQIFKTIGFIGFVSIYSSLLCFTVVLLEYTDNAFCKENDFKCDFYVALIIYSSPQFILQCTEISCRALPLRKKFSLTLCITTLYCIPISMLIGNCNITFLWCISLLIYFASLCVSIYTMDPPLLMNYA